MTVRDRIQQLKTFFEKDIWKISVKDKHPVFSFLVKQGRILIIAVRGYNEDKIQLRASALSFYTMLSIVPILALVFGIAQGFGFQEYLKTVLVEKFHEHEDLLKMLLGFVEKYLGRINQGYIAGIGLIILFWSVMKVLGNIESSFNNIWRIKKSRIISRKFTDYISLVVVAPVLLIIASSFNLSRLTAISDSIPFLRYLDSVLKLLVTVMSFTLIWFVFTLIYIVIPNTKVKFIPALIAGIMAGTMFQLLQWGYVNFQSLLSSYGAIYGTFAALPLFMLWLELSWLIVLLGAEISYAYQNAIHYEQEAEGAQVSLKDKKVLTLMVTKKIIRNFVEGRPAKNAAEIAEELSIPVRIVRDIIYVLLNARIIIETFNQEIREVAYQPALDPSTITVSFVFDEIDKLGHQLPFDKETPEKEKISAIVESFYDDVRMSPKNVLLRDL
jgi:membrane protein